MIDTSQIEAFVNASSSWSHFGKSLPGISLLKEEKPRVYKLCKFDC